MIIGTGIDIVNIKRMKKALGKWGASFKKKVFTAREMEYCAKKSKSAQHFAARFAVKEAVLKALGSGMAAKMKWIDVEVVNESNGKPNVRLSGEIKKIAQKKRVKNVFVSIAHTEDYAVAQAIAEK